MRSGCVLATRSPGWTGTAGLLGPGSGGWAWTPQPDRILITNGTAHAIFLALATVVRPGDVVLTEELTDHGVIGLANVLGFTLRGLPTDREGLLPNRWGLPARLAM